MLGTNWQFFLVSTHRRFAFSITVAKKNKFLTPSQHQRKHCGCVSDTVDRQKIQIKLFAIMLLIPTQNIKIRLSFEQNARVFRFYRGWRVLQFVQDWLEIVAFFIIFANKSSVGCNGYINFRTCLQKLPTSSLSGSRPLDTTWAFSSQSRLTKW